MKVDFYPIEKLYGGYERLSEEELLKFYIEVFKLYDDFDLKDDVDDYGNTVLHIAASHGDAVALKHLILKSETVGARLFKTNNYGETPLHSTLKFRYWEEKPEKLKETVKVLIGAGCNPHKKNESGETFYQKAATLGVYPIFEALKEMNIIPDRVVESSQQTVLHILSEYVRGYEYLYDKPDEYKIKFREHEEPYFRSVKAVLEVGLDPEIKSLIGKTAHDYAVESRAKRIGNILAGLDPEDLSGGMSLHEACFYGDCEAVTALIENGADIDEFYEGNNREWEKMSPLAIALSYLQGDVVKILIEKGANPIIRNGETNFTSIYYLCRAFFNINYIREKNLSEENIKNILSYVLADKKVLNDYVDGEYNTPMNYLAYLSRMGYHYLSRAGKYGEYLLLDKLADKGADVLIGNKNGDTPLHEICKYGGDCAEDIVEMFLELGAELNVQNKNGDTPLMFLAALDKKSQAVELFKLMKQYGNIDTSIINNNGKTALDIAVEKGNESLVAMLI